jgi:hypothetical protein
MNENKNVKKGKIKNLIKNENNKPLNELLNEYDIDKTLGKGNFGKVKLGIHKLTEEKVNYKYNYNLYR